MSDRYQLGEVLAEDDTTTTYQAVDLHLQRSIVVRRLKSEYAGNPRLAQRFLDAARASALYAHPNVAATYDVGVDESAPYAVTEHVEGERLSSIIQNAAPLRPDRIRRLGAQVASALDYVQRHDGVEYGLASDDVMVSGEDQVKVIGFGRTGSPETDPELTEPIPITGIYLDSPDNVGEATTHTGTQAVGVLLYEMATGRHPFQDGGKGVLAHPTTEIVRPAALNPALPVTLERTIIGALETGKGRRYRSLSELIIALQFQDAFSADQTRFRQDTTPRQPDGHAVLPQRTRRGPGWIAVVISTVVLAAVLVSAVAAATVVRPQVEVPSVTGSIFGTDPSAGRYERIAQSQAADLGNAITAVHGNTQEVNTALSRARDKLATEVSTVNGMRSLVDDMKRAVSAQPGTLPAKRQAFELSYKSFEAARNAFQSAANDLQSRLTSPNADVGRASAAAGQLQATLAEHPVNIPVQPKPGDEKGPIAEYNAAVQAAASNLTSMHKTDADMLNAANSLRQQADDAAALKVSAPATPAAPSTPVQGSTATPIPGAAPAATSTPGSTPAATSTPNATPRPTATPTARPRETPGPTAAPTSGAASSPAVRPTAPPAPPSATTYPVGSHFMALFARISNLIGQPVERERTDAATGDVYQRTTGGMLFWQRSTGLAYFTDGFMTWVIGPKGLQSRRNDQLFDWEKAMRSAAH